MPLLDAFPELQAILDRLTAQELRTSWQKTESLEVPGLISLARVVAKIEELASAGGGGAAGPVIFYEGRIDLPVAGDDPTEVKLYTVPVGKDAFITSFLVGQARKGNQLPASYATQQAEAYWYTSDYSVGINIAVIEHALVNTPFQQYASYPETGVYRGHETDELWVSLSSGFATFNAHVIVVGFLAEHVPDDAGITGGGGGGS